MRIIDIKEIIKGQDVPKITYRPIKSMEDRIYFEKVQGLVDEEWTEGIYRYDTLSKDLTRVDQGEHKSDPSLFDIEVPGSYEDVLAVKDMDEIYYCAACDHLSEYTLKYYCLDLSDDSQSEILTFTFSSSEYVYKGFEILTKGYFIFTLSIAGADYDDSQYDRIYLVDVEEKRLYPIYDMVFKLTAGKREVIGKKTKYLLVEEVYLMEDEEIELLLSDELELAIDIPEELDEDFVFENSIKVIPFENFLRLVKAGSRKIIYKELDSIEKDGIIRIVGETDSYIYYKKSIHHHILSASKEFNDRIMRGKEQIFALDKDALEITKITDISSDTMLAFEDDAIYMIEEDEKTARIIDIADQKVIYTYDKNTASPDTKEFFYDIFNHRYLVIGVIRKAERSGGSYLKIIDISGIEDDRRCEDIFVIGDTVFIG